MLGCDPDKDPSLPGLRKLSDDFFFSIGPPLVAVLSIRVLVELERFFMRLLLRELSMETSFRMDATIESSELPLMRLACLNRMTSGVWFGPSPSIASVLDFPVWDGVNDNLSTGGWTSALVASTR